MTKRPAFTIAEAVDRFEVSRSTLRRGITDGRFPSAAKDSQGRWVINVDDLLQEGFTARKTWLNDSAHERVHEPGSQGAHDHVQGVHTSTSPSEQAVLSEHAQLHTDLAHERAHVESLKALLEAERAHVESLKMAMRMIEGRSSQASTQPVQLDEPTSTSQETSGQQPTQAPGIFSRLFKRN